MGRVKSRVAIAVVAAVVLTPLLTLPLGWQKQAVFATALILIAAILNRTLRTTTITLVLMAISVFSSAPLRLLAHDTNLGRHHKRRSLPAAGHDFRSPDVIRRVLRVYDARTRAVDRRLDSSFARARRQLTNAEQPGRRAHRHPTRR